MSIEAFSHETPSTIAPIEALPPDFLNSLVISPFQDDRTLREIAEAYRGRSTEGSLDILLAQSWEAVDTLVNPGQGQVELTGPPRIMALGFADSALATVLAVRGTAEGFPEPPTVLKVPPENPDAERPEKSQVKQLTAADTGFRFGRADDSLRHATMLFARLPSGIDLAVHCCDGRQHNALRAAEFSEILGNRTAHKRWLATADICAEIRQELQTLGASEEISPSTPRQSHRSLAEYLSALLPGLRPSSAA